MNTASQMHQSTLNTQSYEHTSTMNEANNVNTNRMNTATSMQSSQHNYNNNNNNNGNYNSSGHYNNNGNYNSGNPYGVVAGVVQTTAAREVTLARPWAAWRSERWWHRCPGRPLPFMLLGRRRTTIPTAVS